MADKDNVPAGLGLVTLLQDWSYGTSYCRIRLPTIQLRRTRLKSNFLTHKCSHFTTLHAKEDMSTDRILGDDTPHYWSHCKVAQSCCIIYAPELSLELLHHSAEEDYTSEAATYSIRTQNPLQLLLPFVCMYGSCAAGERHKQVSPRIHKKPPKTVFSLKIDTSL